MPQNMQKKPKVAELELDHNLTLDDEVQLEKKGDLDIDVLTLADTDPRYLATLELLKNGNTPKKIAEKLVKKGVFQSRGVAMKLALRVMKENPQEQRTNGYIQLGVAAFFAVIGLILIVPSIITTGAITLSPSYLMFVISGWFVYKGYQTLTKLNAKKQS
ncbi:MAG: hypothetical protein WBC91_13205 [Phototrophicaceae bacterium]